MELTKWLKGRSAETILYMAKSKINMFKEGKKLDKMLDDQIGEASSERIQRGVITTLLHNLLRGLWNENLQSLAVFYEQKAKELRKEK